MLNHLATTIIQRAWRRNRGLAALGEYLKCDFFDKIREQLFEYVDPKFLLKPENVAVYKRWILKLFIRAGITNASELSSHPFMIACWFVFVHKQRWHSYGEGLVLATDFLVFRLMEFLECDYSNIRKLKDDVQAFFNAFTSWRVTHLQQFNIRLRHNVIESVYSLVRHNVTAESQLIRFRRLISLYTIMDPDAQNFQSSPIYQSLLLSSRNSLWTPYISQAKYVHALLHDSRFIVDLDQSIPEIQTRHTIGGQIVDSLELRRDVMCVMMGAVEDAATLERIANVFHELKDCHDSLLFSGRIVELLMDLISDTPFSPRVNAVWEKIKDTRPLMALVFAVRALRNMLDNASVDFVRQRMIFFSSDNNPTPAAFAIMQVAENERTLRWIDFYIRKCNQETLNALSEGNPFALLEFFNQSILEMVVNKNTIIGETFLTEEKLPEFLRYDRAKLIDIRLDLSTCDFDLRHFTELVNSGKWMGSSTCTLTLVHASDKLRRILQLNRYFHGQGVCRSIVEMAKHAVLNLCLD